MKRQFACFGAHLKTVCLFGAQVKRQFACLRTQMKRQFAYFGAQLQTVCLLGAQVKRQFACLGAQVKRQFACLGAQVKIQFGGLGEGTVWRLRSRDSLEAQVNRWFEEAQVRGQFEVVHAKRLDKKMYNNSKMKIRNRV